MGYNHRIDDALFDHQVSDRIRSMKKLAGLNTEITFGEYKDKTWKYVYMNDPTYIMWVHNNDIQQIVFNPNFIDMVEKKLKGRKQGL